jgi:hypothetical protein
MDLAVRGGRRRSGWLFLFSLPARNWSVVLRNASNGPVDVVRTIEGTDRSFTASRCEQLRCQGKFRPSTKIGMEGQNHFAASGTWPGSSQRFLAAGGGLLRLARVDFTPCNFACAMAKNGAVITAKYGPSLVCGTLQDPASSRCCCTVFPCPMALRLKSEGEVGPERVSIGQGGVGMPAWQS